MSKKVKAEDLGNAIAQELTVYHEDVIKKINQVGREAIDKLVKLTKATAPVGARGSYKKHIAADERKVGRKMKKYTWYVKAPDYRLTHLLVHGHATKDGGRTKGDPFLADALDQVLPEYEKGVEDACK